MRERSGRFASYTILLAGFALVFLLHAPYFNLPYFWDELGQFVPAAFDIYQDAAWVPHSTVPNAHPPGVMAYLALVWKIFGYSIPITRAAMLVFASLTVFATFLLATELSPGVHDALPFIPALLLLADPLFYMQGMMAQLDMPAMLFTVVSLLLFLKDRHAAAALACIALVLSKETGALLPLIFIVIVFLEKRRKYVFYYAASFAVLAVWFFVLRRSTGHLFGDAGFTHYNLGYAMNPVRATLCLIRRVFYLFIDDFRWVGTLAIILAFRRTAVFRTRAWRITWLFIAAHVVMVSVLGGAELERYLLPVLPLVYIAMAAAWWTLPPVGRNVSIAAATAGLVAGLFINPPYPFPFENNLAMVDFVDLQRDAAQYLERTDPKATIFTAWPLTAALRNPRFGYVKTPLAASETSDFRYSTLARLNPQGVHVLVLYSRTWEPQWSVLRWPIVMRFLSRFYEYEPQMTAAQVRGHFGLIQEARWSRRAQWIEVYGEQRTALQTPQQ